MIGVFDIGGTHTRVGISEDGTTITRYEIFKTDQAFDSFIEHFSTIFRKLAGSGWRGVLVGGVPGALDRERQRVLRSPHLTHWEGEPLGDALCRACNAQTVYCENDAALSGLAEGVRGAGQGHTIVGYMTIGTGVGGTRIVDGQIDRATYNFEIGQQLIQDARTLESYISGSAIRTQYGGDFNTVTDKSVIDKILTYASYGIVNMIMHWSPECIVIGGGVATTPQFDIDILKNTAKVLVKIFPEIPTISKAILDNDTRGLEGALCYYHTQKQYGV